jgi:hypothetical protein
MGIIYDFVNKHIKTHSEPSFMIPKMCFMKNALAIIDMTHETYMVEEVIDEAVHGTFMKYIGSGSVKPYESLDGAAAYRAEFWVFYQHIQYLKTSGLAFIGDFQGKSSMSYYPYVALTFLFCFSGGTCLLTDPQIITASYVSKQDSRLDSNPKYYKDMGLIFSDGNLLSTHTTFPTQHICNMFCNFFKLLTFSTQNAGEPLFTNNACPNTWEEGEVVSD